MIRGRELIGMPVYYLDRGEKIGAVRNLVFDPNEGRIIGLILREGGFFRRPQVLPYEAISAVGPDALVLKQGIEKTSLDLKVDPSAIKEGSNLTGRKVVTNMGHQLGAVYDLEIDELTGKVIGLYLTQGLFRDTAVGKKYIEYDSILIIGRDSVIVDASAVDQVATQKGGLSATVENVKEAGVESLEKARERSEALGRIVREKGEAMTGRLSENKETWGGSAQEKMEGYKKRGREKVERGRRKASEFWEGLSSRLEEAGQRSKGLFERLREQIENRRIEQALGRRVSRTLLDPSDEVILRQGDIITHRTILQAREGDILDSLLNSVVKENIFALRRKETESASEEVFSKRPPLPEQKEGQEKAA